VEQPPRSPPFGKFSLSVPPLLNEKLSESKVAIYRPAVTTALRRGVCGIRALNQLYWNLSSAPRYWDLLPHTRLAYATTNIERGRTARPHPVAGGDALAWDAPAREGMRWALPRIADSTLRSRDSSHSC
jgi:hypothetical protein